MADFNNSCPGMCHASASGKLDTGGFRPIIKANDTTVMLLTPKEALSLWLIDQQKKGKITAAEATEQWDVWNKANEIVSMNITTIVGTLAGLTDLNTLIKDLGSASTKAYIKYYGGKPHIVIKGYPGLRTILNAPKYGLRNPKIMQMGLGKFGAIKGAKAGGILTVIVVAAFRVVEFFLTDKATLTELIGTLATDIVKIGISVGASMAAVALGAGAVFGAVAIGPLVAAIVVGAAVGVLLDWLDNKYHITEKVIQALEQVGTFSVIQFQAIKNVAIDLRKKAIDEIGHKVEQIGEAALLKLKRYIIKKAENVIFSMPLPRLSRDLY